MAAGSVTAFPQSLEEGLVYLVRARIQDPGVPLADLHGVLSQEERDRAARFRFEEDSLRSRVAWGLLRLFLGRLLGREPASLGFVQNEYGKPRLQDGPSFNLAHSGAWVLIGLASGGRLGVDVEWCGRVRDVESLAQTVFAPDELAEFRSFPQDQRPEAFYRGWARKEAFVKAVGEGLSLPLKGFSVSLAPGFGDALLQVESSKESGIPWQVRSLPELPGAEGAFAWDVPLRGIRCIDPERLGFDEKAGFANLDKIKSYGGPTLILHAEYDHIIPFSDSKALFAASPAPTKRHVKIPGANHNDIFIRGMDIYLDAVQQFCEGVERP